MDITFTCTKCGQELEIDQAGAGVEVSCPKCQAALLVPHISTVPAGKLKETIRLSPFPPMGTAAPAPSPPPQRPARPPAAPAPSASALYSLPGSATPPARSSPAPAIGPQAVRAVITNFDMPLPEMMKVALKWMVAALPAFVILFLLAALIFKLLGVLVRP